MEMSLLASTTSVVEKTCLDAILAKWSSLKVGYGPVTAHPDVYFELLQLVVRQLLTVTTTTTAATLLKRQCPLVNAGYAARMASVAGTVQQFLEYHCNHGNAIDVVVLGCGLDILGLWMYSLVSKLGGDARIIEIDTPQVSRVKRTVLTELGLVETSNPGEADYTFQARIHLPNILRNVDDDAELDVQSTGLNYFLLEGDLRNLEWLEYAFRFRNLTRLRPTLVLSELVFAYLGEDGIDQLLTFCARSLCKVGGSVLVALEPFGSSKQQHFQTLMPSVANSYRDEYCRQFQAKLARGIASSDRSHDVGTCETLQPLFCTPLGPTCQSVENRCLNAGFHSAYGCTMGVSTAWAQSKWNAMLRTLEPFDEYSALLLHLNSYVLVCAFSEYSVDLQRSMCGWSRGLMSSLYLSPCKVTTNSNQGGAIFTISEIQSKSEDQQVRDIFCRTYESLFDEYPSVKRLVKSALKGDLASNQGTSSLTRKSSIIGARYQDLGGIFIIAVEGDVLSQSVVVSRRVVGFVGVRYWTSSIGSANEKALEIQRLVVDEGFRGHGIGRALLRAVENSLQVCLNQRCQLLATTPSILASANELYISNGFALIEVKKSSNLTMNTYSKFIDVDIK